MARGEVLAILIRTNEVCESIDSRSKTLGTKLPFYDRARSSMDQYWPRRRHCHRHRRLKHLEEAFTG